jgi:hypothetical protein
MLPPLRYSVKLSSAQLKSAQRFHGIMDPGRPDGQLGVGDRTFVRFSRTDGREVSRFPFVCEERVHPTPRSTDPCGNPTLSGPRSVMVGSTPRLGK